MNRTVLVVDDETTVRTVLRTRLTLSGYRALEAGSGEQALALLESETPDALLLDLRLPGMDGWQVLDKLRQLKHLSAMRIVVVSAYGGDAVESRAREYGCRAVLQKPFALRELMATLDRVLAE
jgi:CheY-like chemotaxis protein